MSMTDLAKKAREYVAMNAAESGADILLLDMADDLDWFSRQLAEAQGVIERLMERMCPECEGLGFVPSGDCKRCNAIGYLPHTAALSTTDKP